MSTNAEGDGNEENGDEENGKSEELHAETDESGSMWGPWLLAGGAAAIGAGAVGITVGKKVLRRIRNRRRADGD